MSALRRFPAVVLPAIMVMSFTGTALASGFQLREQSTTAQGNAFAGVAAGTDDISAMFFNPATMTQHDGSQTSFHLSYIAPKADMTSASGTTAFGTAISGGKFGGDAGEDALLPSVYAMFQPAEDWRVGLSVNAPFGLATEYDKEWVGRYHGVRSELVTTNLSPNIAWQATPWMSLGAGLQVQYADAELSNSIDFGGIGAAAGISGATPGNSAQDGFGEVKGDDWSYGYTLGVVFNPLASTQIGLSYRSQVKHTLEGDAVFDLGTSGIGAALSGATGAFTNTTAKASLTTPSVVSLGVRHAVTEEWTVMAELDWTEWSTFEELRIRFDNAAQSDSVTDQNWEDVWFASLGATYKPTGSPWTFRGGVAFDEAPMGTDTRTPRIPDENRYWISGGVSYDPRPWISIGATYTHIFVDDAKVDLSTSDTGNTFRGALAADYESSIDIFSIAATIRF